MDSRMSVEWHSLLFPEFRLDWFGLGPGSANKTGALFAMLMVGSWGIWALLPRRGYWMSLLLSGFWGMLLLQSGSRGGLLAAGVGLLILATLVYWRRADGGWPVLRVRLGQYRSRLIAGLLVVVLLSVYAANLQVGERVVSGVAGQDDSANVRVELYLAGLRMVSDAPWGWGAGSAGKVFGNWYQNPGSVTEYLSLVNSHLTWMADYGVLFQTAYVGLWAGVFCVCYPNRKRRRGGTEDQDAKGYPEGMDASDRQLTVALAVWLTLGLAACFSTVLTTSWLWLLPVVFLAWVTVLRIWHRWFPERRMVVQTFAFFYCGLLVLHAAGWSLGMGESPRLNATPARVVMHGGEQDGLHVAVVSPDERSLGGRYGQVLREFAGVLGRVTVFHDEVPRAQGVFDVAVYSGPISAAGLGAVKADHIFLFNPVFENDDDLVPILQGRKVTVVGGELVDWRRRRSWDAALETLSGVRWVRVAGARDFIPDWPLYLLEEGEPEMAQQTLYFGDDYGI